MRAEETHSAKHRSIRATIFPVLSKLLWLSHPRKQNSDAMRSNTIRLERLPTEFFREKPPQTAVFAITVPAGLLASQYSDLLLGIFKPLKTARFENAVSYGLLDKSAVKFKKPRWEAKRCGNYRFFSTNFSCGKEWLKIFRKCHMIK